MLICIAINLQLMILKGRFSIEHDNFLLNVLSHGSHIYQGCSIACDCKKN